MSAGVLKNVEIQCDYCDSLIKFVVINKLNYLIVRISAIIFNIYIYYISVGIASRVIESSMWYTRDMERRGTGEWESVSIARTINCSTQNSVS